jgi:Aspartyl protease
MNIQVRDGLPYVTVTLLYGGQQLDLANVLLDTGSAGTLFAADQVLAVGLQYEADDPVQRMRGIGGAEFVFVKRIDRLSVGELQVRDFEIEVGAMDYGFAIDGIIGTDFLLQVGAVIDLSRLEIHRASP